MVFSEDIIKDICNKSGLLFDRAGDFGITIVKGI